MIDSLRALLEVLLAGTSHTEKVAYNRVVCGDSWTARFFGVPGRMIEMREEEVMHAPKQGGRPSCFRVGVTCTGGAFSLRFRPTILRYSQQPVQGCAASVAHRSQGGFRGFQRVHEGEWMPYEGVPISSVHCNLAKIMSDRAGGSSCLNDGTYAAALAHLPG